MRLSLVFIFLFINTSAFSSFIHLLKHNNGDYYTKYSCEPQYRFLSECYRSNVRDYCNSLPVISDTRLKHPLVFSGLIAANQTYDFKKNPCFEPSDTVCSCVMVELKPQTPPSEQSAESLDEIHTLN